MPNEDLLKYKTLYLQTARDYIKSLEKNLDLLLQNTHDEDAIKQARIDSHSLKSQSLLMQYNHLGHYCEAIEKIMAVALENKLTLNTELLQSMKQGTRQMQLSLEEIEKHDTDIDLAEEEKKLTELAGNK